MDPTGATFGVVALSKDAYLTAQFTKNTILVIKEHEREYVTMALDFEVQFFRFKNLSRHFRGADGSTIDTAILKNMAEVRRDQSSIRRWTDLSLISVSMRLCSNTATRYTVVAASINESYRKNSPLSPQFDVNRLKKTLVIDDVSVIAEPQSPILGPDERADDKSEHGAAAEMKEKDAPWPHWPGAPGYILGFAWWFKKDRVAETLAEFTDWNKRVEHLVAPLMSGFGFYDSEALQNRLQLNGKENIFKGILELIKLSDTLDGGAETSKSGYLRCSLAECGHGTKISRAEFRIKASGDPCGIYPEYKELGIVQQTKAKTTTRELYGHQLARLLVAAGKGHSNTLQLNSYSFQCRQGAMLVRSIGALHAVGWLHKSIRSHSIKFFFVESSEKRRKQGFTQMHNIYSVGVVLLEIGRWETAREIYDLMIEYDLGGKVPKDGVSATQIQDSFMAEARDRLGRRIGSSYRDGVFYCLSGEMDDYIGERNFANEFQKRVVEKVDIRLRE
ncbi:hypothetical protein MFIFM68171_11319 [Madurella fahalii]|uniref:Protein kinase domain-containing protein n=1 Tax=Madurella fahalii TaxID=1157608 RepID=A0ABQ0GTN9_9PEZI